MSGALQCTVIVRASTASTPLMRRKRGLLNSTSCGSWLSCKVKSRSSVVTGAPPGAQLVSTKQTSSAVPTVAIRWRMETPFWAACGRRTHLGSALQKVDEQAVELLGLLVLRPVPGVFDDVKARAGHLLVRHL